MKRRRDEESEMEIVWQTPANPPEHGDYIFRNGKRYVRPYHFEFISHVKNRWAGKTIVDLFTEEFKGRPYAYYVNAVESGRIQVDGEMVPVSYIVQSSQKISHFVHRHEPPVLALGVSILRKEPDVLTVCKPASVPVHPCGQYRKNTVVGILQAEHGLAPLFPVHRLDRLVSGLLILARSASKADSFRQQIESGMVQKQYIAKVNGVFPDDESVSEPFYHCHVCDFTIRLFASMDKQVVNVNVNYNAREGRSTVEVGNCHGNTPSKGKSACTKFTRIGTNGTHSIVLCEPITGRTHQIRVHLQYTGHPIANDMLYLSEFSVDRSTKGLSADRAAANSGPSFLSSSPKSCVDDRCNDNFSVDFRIDPMCTNCPNLAPKGYEGDQEGLWLHCMRYSGPDWVYECPQPEWASLE